jgi:hypothetical protein
MKLDLADTLGLLGVILLGAAIWAAWGLWGLVGYAGMVLLLMSTAMAMQRGRRAAK